MNGKNLQELISNLQIFYKCPSCGSRYKHDDITFLGRVDEHCFMQLSCNECSLPILATVLMSSQLTKKAKSRANNIAFGSKIQKDDLSSKEKRHFSELSPISADEIANLHLYLTEHQTDLDTRF
jgi:hypothetical protein